MRTTIWCIGKDGLRHLCYPDATETICGKQIASKKTGSRDWKRFACIACDYTEIEELKG